jgi:transcriptional regulator GlxA family with amidase domain
MQHTVHREPFAAVLALRQLHTFPQTVSTQSCIGELLQLPCCRALSALLALERLSVAGIGVAARQKVSLCRDMRKSVAQASVRLLLSRFLPSDWRWMRRAQTAVGCIVGGEERVYLLLQRTLVDGVRAAGQWQVEVRFRFHEHITLDGG